MPARPRVKSTNPVFEVGDSVFIQRCGSMLEIEDPDGDVRVLLSLADGSRTAAEIDREFRALRPDSSFDIPSAIGQLDEYELVIDAGAQTRLDDYEQERWKRNIGFFEACATLTSNKFTMQEQLIDAKVTLLGVGGVGSHVALDLLGLGVGDLRIVDFDTVDLSNLNRQILYREADVGSDKIGLAERRLREYAPRAKISAVERRLSRMEDIEEVVADRDFVICAADRPKAQLMSWLNEACVRSRVPFCGGGVDTKRSVLYLIIPGTTGCVECWYRSAVTDELSLAIRGQQAKLHREESGVGPDLAAFGPMVTALTTLMVTEFVRVVTGLAEPIAAGRLIETYFGDLAIREAEKWERLPDCPVCGKLDSAAGA